MNVADKTRELIEAGRRELVLDDERLEQNRDRILTRAVAAGVLAVGVTASASAGAVTGASTGAVAAGAGAVSKAAATLAAVKLALTVVVVSGSVGGAYVLATRGQQAELAPQATPSKLTVPDARAATRPPPAGVDPAPSPVPLAEEPAPSTSGARAAGGGKAHASATSLSEHAELLRDARTALASGDAAKALAVIDAHPEVGRGALGPEWGAARILVLCRLGRVAESKQLARRFLKAHPSSPLAAQVAASCAGSD